MVKILGVIYLMFRYNKVYESPSIHEVFIHKGIPGNGYVKMNAREEWTLKEIASTKQFG